VITIVLLLFPESSVKGPKVNFLTMSEVSFYYFFRVTGRRKRMD